MRRLVENQTVWIGAADRDSPGRACRVVAVDRDCAALYPLSGAVHDRGASSAQHFMTFDHNGRPVALRGRLDVLGDHDLRFRPTDGVALERRTAPRLDVEVPIQVAAAAPPWTALDGVTVNLSADGAMVRPAGGFSGGDRVAVVVEPVEGLRIAADGVVVRIVGDCVAILFAALDPELRTRVVEHVIARKAERVAADLRRPPARA